MIGSVPSAPSATVSIGKLCCLNCGMRSCWMALICSFCWGAGTPSVNRMTEPDRCVWAVAAVSIVSDCCKASYVGVAESGLQLCDFVAMVLWSCWRAATVAISAGCAQTCASAKLCAPPVGPVLSSPTTPTKSPGPLKSIYALAAEQRKPLGSLLAIEPDMSSAITVTCPEGAVAACTVVPDGYARAAKEASGENGSNAAPRVITVRSNRTVMPHRARCPLTIRPTIVPLVAPTFMAVWYSLRSLYSVGWRITGGVDAA